MKSHLKYILTQNVLIVLILGLCVFGIVKYIDYRFSSLSVQIESSKNSIAVAEETFNNKIKELGEVFFSTLSEEQQKNKNLKEELSGITDSVDELEKLSATDPELLQKYSKVYFLNEHYVPISLSNIGEEYVNKKGTNLQIHSDVLSHLEDMIDSATNDGLSVKVLSAFRSFGTQSVLKANYTFTYGAGTANKFSADQGYSEHQLGTTMDFTTVTLDGNLVGFEKTSEYVWLLGNAHKYGFVLSYPAGNTYYKFEPWHWRFVGVSLARRLHNDEMNFYDMDQRIIDTFLTKIFD
ncbi:MAG: M15 family metallopeptidase [bacterium]|nr:M15 family metallopeptidase [bacterium]